MPKPVFDKERCKGCSLCIRACPKKILALADNFNVKGYNPVYCLDEGQCIGCKLCAQTCPDIVIEIYK